MSSPFSGFGQSSEVAGLWVKVDASNFIGGVYQITLSASTVSFYYGGLATPITINYGSDASANAKFEQVRSVLSRLGALVDLS